MFHEDFSMLKKSKKALGSMVRELKRVHEYVKFFLK